MKADVSLVELTLNQTGRWPIPRELLERGVAAVLEREEVRAGALSVTFMDDPGIQALNREYLGRDHPTDVLAFALHSVGEPVLGDIYIGYDQASRQAEDLSVPLAQELLRLAVHGTLHVLGYDHPEGTERAESEMYRLQEEHVSRVLSTWKETHRPEDLP